MKAGTKFGILMLCSVLAGLALAPSGMSIAIWVVIPFGLIVVILMLVEVARMLNELDQ